MKRETFTADHGERKTTWKINPAHQERRRSDLKPDGTVDLEGNIGDEFEQVLDELNDHMTGRNKSLPASRNEADPINQARSRSEVERELNILQAAMRDVLTEILAPTGLTVEACVRHDVTYNFTFFARDSFGRRFDVDLSLNDADEISERAGLKGVVDQVAKQILAARDAYHARVNEVMGVGN